MKNAIFWDVTPCGSCTKAYIRFNMNQLKFMLVRGHEVVLSVGFNAVSLFQSYSTFPMNMSSY
jgi:hypothetical protein